MELAVVTSLGEQVLGLIHPQTEGVFCALNVILRIERFFSATVFILCEKVKV